MSEQKSFLGWFVAGVLGAVTSTAFAGLILPLIDKDFFSYPGCWIRKSYYDLHHRSRYSSIISSMTIVEDSEPYYESIQSKELSEISGSLVLEQVAFKRADGYGVEFSRKLVALNGAGTILQNRAFEKAFREYVAVLEEYNAPRTFLLTDRTQLRIRSQLSEPETCVDHFPISNREDYLKTDKYVPPAIMPVEIPTHLEVLMESINFVEQFGSFYRLDDQGKATWRQ